MSEDVDDNFKDFFDEIRKILKINSGIFDLDFYMFIAYIPDQFHSQVSPLTPGINSSMYLN